MASEAIRNGPIDFAIITALRVERTAVLSRIDPGYETVKEDNEPLTYVHGHISVPSSGERYTVVVVMLLGMGNDEAAVATTRVIQRWKPSHVLMVGIAAGVHGKVDLGDVVVAESCYYYELAKRTPSGEQRRPQQFPTDRLLYGRAQAYEASEWKGEIGIERPAAPESRVPEAHFGLIASGEKVIADKTTLLNIREGNQKIIAVAMEGAGVARAALNNNPPVAFLEIRGVCDFADDQKNDDWQDYAANAAAAFTVGFLRSRPISPLQAKPQEGKTAPLLVMRMQSLRPIAPDELLSSFGGSLKGRDVETVSLDFTDLVSGDSLSEPEEAIRRLVDPKGVLFGVLARRGDAELVFHGLVHIPLAVLAGHIVTDRQRVQMFDFHPNVGSGTWAWPEKDEQGFPDFEVSGLSKRKVKSAGEAIVRVSVSYQVSSEQAGMSVHQPALEVDMGVPSAGRGIVRSEEQTRAYGREFRRVLDGIAQRAPMCHRVHLFYAGPVSLAFHLGQQISANIHPPVTVWNFRRGSYEWGIDLAAASLGESCLVYSKRG
ncbi:MAG TPA: SAVED domain-containing protein [Thermoanaerobaculia bacterium]